ncbi:MAG: IS66 family transposase [Clostridia bacterium]
MKNVVKINEISKEELYKLYITEVEKYEALQAKFYEQQKELADKTKKLEEANFQLIQRNKTIFGSKKETHISDNNDFNEAENNSNKKDYKKRNRKKETNNLTRDFLEKHYSEVVTLDPEEIKSNNDLFKIGEDVTFKIETVPARLKIIKIISNKYIDKKEGKIYQKIKEDEKYPHSFCTPSFASELIYNKYILGVPYYRQEEYLYKSQIQISRQNLCNYQIKTSEIIKPMYDYLIKKLLTADVKILHADETTLQVLDSNKSKCYVWLFNSSFYDNPIYIYKFSPTRSRDVALQFLKDYSGYLITDCYQAYENIPNVINSYCWVHARRNFVEILDSVPQERKKESISQKVVNEIDKMFSLDRKYREDKLTASMIKKLRNEGEFKEHLDKVFEIIENANPASKSRLEQAINYILSRKKSFTEILNDGRLDLSNNSAERGVKPFVMARKNFLFSNTSNGAESSVIVFSILQTAIANGLDAKLYLNTLIEKINPNSTEEELENLLPWKIKL